MEFKSRFFGKVLCAGLLAVASSFAGASTVFFPTDGDVNFLFSNLGSNQLFMFDDDDNNNFAAALDNLSIPLPSIVGIAGPNGSGDYIATNSLANTLTLTGSDQFVLAIFDGANWIGDTSVTANGANAYTVEFDVGGNVLAVDVQVVPVPAAVWLFGSGLLGFTMVGRRQRQ